MRASIFLSRMKRTIRLGFRSLWLHRLRSLLTVLGIVFGVCSVIAMLAVGEGASHEAQEQIKRLGSSNIIIRSLKPPDEQKSETSRSFVVEYGITYSDLERIRATIPGVTVVMPGRIIRNYVYNLTRRVDCDIIGSVFWYPEMHGSVVAEGRFFSETEMDKALNVCVLGAGMAEELFPIDSPIGKTVRVSGEYYRVVGTMASDTAKENEDGTTDENSKDDQASSSKSSENGKNGGSGGAGVVAGASQPAAFNMYIPLTTAKTRFGEVLMKRRSGSFEAERIQLHDATIKVERQEDVVDVAAIVTDLLTRYHKKKDYTLIVPLELLRQAERTQQIFNIVLGSIAAISLLVGGIGIMNIMLASVTERTREIGIRRALGAKRRDIIVQFLIETVILSGLGGLIGVGLGIVIPFGIAYFAHMTTIITFWSPIIAFSISGLVGVIFGLYPAFRAANMDPVEALRHE